MASLTIGWDYLTGYAVATAPTERGRPEWPPHPARVFMALAAAWFETRPDEPEELSRWELEGEALRHVEALGEPELILPRVGPDAARSEATVYVPVNDSAGPSLAVVQSCPSITRGRQARAFPRTWVGAEPCYLRWDDPDGTDATRESLARLCRKVTRIGHSSSLVRMWLADGMTLDDGPSDRFVADDGPSVAFRARAISGDMLAMLGERYGEEARAEEARIAERIEELARSRKEATGPGVRDRKAQADREIASLRAERSSLTPRPPARPTVGLWSGYRPVEALASDGPARGLFDAEILVLRFIGGPALAASTTLSATAALRGAILKHFGDGAIPGWVSGHEAGGDPLRDGRGHLALIPLPFVGHDHADGHLLGMGLVFPRGIDREERGRVLGRWLLDDDGRPRIITLRPGRLPECTAELCDWTERRATLRAESWTGAESGSTTWASVTPVGLDRFPRAIRDDPSRRGDWEAEVRATVAESCLRIGLPAPTEIDVDTTCWHRGGPRAVARRRPLRGGNTEGDARLATTGDGFPPFPAKGTNASRPQVHVWLRFDGPVAGPVILGAGRFLGYGLCKPWKERRG